MRILAALLFSVLLLPARTAPPEWYGARPSGAAKGSSGVVSVSLSAMQSAALRRRSRS